MNAKITQLPVSVHEKMIEQFKTKDEDDPALDALEGAIKIAREVCARAQHVTQAVLANQMKSPAQRHKQARDAGFTMLANATKAIDDATAAVNAEIESISQKVRAPALSNDARVQARAKEIRERLSTLPDQRRAEIVSAAIKNDDAMLLGAVLSEPAFLSGFASEESLAMARGSWQVKHHKGDLDRRDRLHRALQAATRAGSLTVNYIDRLTDPKLIEAAEAAEARAAAALKEAVP